MKKIIKSFSALFTVAALMNIMALPAMAEEATQPTVYEFNSINSFITAYKAAVAGDIIRMTADTTVQQLNTTGAASVADPIYKAVIIDLNGFTLTTTSQWGGMMLGGYASAINGTIKHTGKTCAIKAYEVDRLEDLVIIIESSATNTGGISLRDHNTMGKAHINTIKNVKMIGTGNYGIETYGKGDPANKTRPVIDLIENVEIDSITYGLDLSASIGKIKNSVISGSQSGISIKNSNDFSVTINFEGDNEIIGANSAVLINYSSATGTVGITADKYTDFICTSGAAAFVSNIGSTTATDFEIVGYTVSGNSFTECDHNVVGGSCTERAECSVCGKAFDFVHNFVEDESKREPANCTIQGKAYFNCECGATSEEFIPRDPNAHEWVSTTKDPTHTEDGLISYNCLYGSCVGEEYTTTIPALGHTYDDGVKTSATCDKAGFTTFTCSCGHSYEVVDENDPALGHSYEKTGSGDGYVEYTCGTCGDVKQEEVLYVSVAVSAIEIDGDEAKLTIGSEYTEAIVYFGENLGEWGEPTTEEVVDGVVTVPATTSTGFFKVEAK